MAPGTSLKQLQPSKLAAVNKLLGDLQATGQIKVADLHPSLNAWLSNPENGGFAGRVFFGQRLSYAQGVEMPPVDPREEPKAVDVMELRDVTGDVAHETFNFYAGNNGVKAMLAQVREAPYMIIAFKGETESDRKGLNPRKDYWIVGIQDRAVGQKLYDGVKAAGK